ncbi:MAG TPA: two-component regulator propeller domain-containing protein, partial [Rubricoccaceae bacterium]|nr:two-component regulator propeller domain-containing protein [Rubricoccaceae bacterium]
GALWLGTLGGGLLRRDPATGAVARYRHRPGDAGSLPSDDVWALLPGPGGVLWVGTGEGLAGLDRATGRVWRVVLPPAGRHVRRAFIYVLASDGRGGVWAGGSTLLFRLDAETAQLQDTVDLAALGNEPTVEALRVDRHGRLWIGTEKRGLWMRDAGGTLTRVRALPPNATVWAIHEARDGSLWLGTATGLVRLDPARGALTRRDDPAQPAAVVYSLLEDAGGRLWLGTGNGLRRHDPRTGRSRAYDAGDGLVNGEFNRRAAAAGPSGRLYFGGLDGVTVFDPAAVRAAPPPPVVLTRVERSGRDGTRALDPRGLGPGGLRLSPRDLIVTFEFVALGFTNAARHRYAYTLEGFDAGWVEGGGTRAVRYTNLPPGHYTFRVRAANADGVWNEAGAALPVTVPPPFWRTWWFRLLALVFVAGVLAVAYHLRVRHLIALERVRLRIASDLHDDVGSKLGSIALMTEMVATRADLGARERGQLEEVARAARRMAGDLRDIVWLVRPGHDTLGDLAAKLEHVAAGMLDGVAVTVEAADGAEAPLPMEARRHLFLVYREALHNVARHARATRVAVRLAREPGGLVLEVRDDGAGFDPSAATDGNGLASLRERARQLGGTLDLESRPGGGTTLRLVVPLRKTS